MATDWDGNPWDVEEVRQAFVDECEPTTLDKVNDIVGMVAMSTGFVVAFLVFIYLWGQS